MQVRQLLAGNRGPVETTTPATVIHEVAKILRNKKIGLVVVSGEKGAIAGVLSERDIIRGLANRGAGIVETTVSELMTRDVLTCLPSDDTAAVLRRMWINNIRHMPVVEDGELVGILSVRDLLKSITQEGGARARDILIEVLREGRYYPGT